MLSSLAIVSWLKGESSTRAATVSQAAIQFLSSKLSGFFYHAETNQKTQKTYLKASIW